MTTLAPTDRASTPTRETPTPTRERSTPSRALGLTPKRERELALLDAVQRLGSDDTRRVASAELTSTLVALAAEPNERAIAAELGALLKMLTRQLELGVQKGPAVVAVVDLLAESARQHKTADVLPALPHVVGALLKALQTCDGRVHRAIAAAFGAFTACLDWSSAACAEECAPPWQGVQLGALLGPLTGALSGQIKELQTGACVCLVEIVSMAKQALLRDALAALVGRLVALIKGKQTLASAQLLGVLCTLSKAAGDSFEPHVERLVFEAVALGRERRTLLETDDWHVKKAATELLRELCGRFPQRVPSERDDDDAARAADGRQPTVSREAVYRLLGKLRTDPAKPVREAVADALDQLRARCPLPEGSAAARPSPASDRRASASPGALRGVKEALAAAAAAAKENAPDDVFVISPPPRAPPPPSVADLLSDEAGRAFGERRNARPPSPKPPSGKKGAALVATAVPTVTLQLDTSSALERADDSAETAAELGSAAPTRASSAEGVFVPSMKLQRTPLAGRQPSPPSPEREWPIETADDWKRMLSPSLDGFMAAFPTPRTLPRAAEPGTPLAAAAAAATPSAVAVATPRTVRVEGPERRTRLPARWLLVAVAVAAGLALARAPARAPAAVDVARPARAHCVTRRELGNVEVQHCSEALSANAQPASVDAAALPATPAAPLHGMPAGADAHFAGGVGACAATDARTCDVVGWTVSEAELAATAARTARADHFDATLRAVAARALAALVALVVGCGAALALKARLAPKKAELGLVFEYDERLQSPVRRSRRISNAKSIATSLPLPASPAPPSSARLARAPAAKALAL
jgi:hypothetical protein